MKKSKHVPGEEMQRTPRGEEIPIPTRGDFMKNLKKAAKPSTRKSPPKK